MGLSFTHVVGLTVVGHGLDEIDYAFQPEIEPRRIKDLATLTFFKGKASVVLLGPPGVGETMLAVGLAVTGTPSTTRCSPTGPQLVDDADRVGAVTALGLDETLFGRRGKWRIKRWSTSIVDVRGGQLLDVVVGRDALPAARWLANRPAA